MNKTCTNLITPHVVCRFYADCPCRSDIPWSPEIKAAAGRIAVRLVASPTPIER